MKRERQEKYLAQAWHTDVPKKDRLFWLLFPCNLSVPFHKDKARGHQETWWKILVCLTQNPHSWRKWIPSGKSLGVKGSDWVFQCSCHYSLLCCHTDGLSEPPCPYQSSWEKEYLPYWIFLRVQRGKAITPVPTHYVVGTAPRAAHACPHFIIKTTLDHGCLHMSKLVRLYTLSARTSL